MKQALLLVDLQNDFLRSPGLEPAAGAVIERAAALLRECRRVSIPIVHVWTTLRPGEDRRMSHWIATGKRICTEGTEGHAPPPLLAPLDTEPLVHKTAFSAFSTGDLDSLLSSLGIDTLWIAGVHLHACVRTTALDAYQRGFQVEIVDDAVGSDDPLHAAVTRRYLSARSISFRNAVGLIGDASATSPEKTERSRADINAVTTAGKNAWRQWRHSSLDSRTDMLERLAVALEKSSVTLGRRMAETIGKPVRYGGAEVQRAATLLRATAEQGRTPLHRNCGEHSVAHQRSLGLIAIVTPWNNPVAIPIGKIAPALAFGNTVIWKPSPAAAALSELVMDHLVEAGCPQDVVTLLHGDRRKAETLMEDKNIDAITITGSPSAGWSAKEISARRSVPLQAELGGNNSAIVWADSDLRISAEYIAEGAFGFAGQRCTANRRVIVDPACYDRFLDLLGAAVRSLGWGDPTQYTTHVGPLVSWEKLEEVREIVERARPAADSILTPHTAAPGLSAPFYPPTIVCCSNPSLEIVQEETFGPVLVVQKATGWEHAIELCNGVRQGLAAALFTASEARQSQFLEGAQAGILKINGATAGADASAPFGGWKTSGMGPPEHGEFNREFYTRPQAVYRNETP